jgi:hypothetical protein
MKILISLLFLFILSINAYAFDENCIESNNFPFCLYKDSKIDFIILRDEKEVGWHKVEFEKTTNGFNVITEAYIKARYLLVLDYIFEYSSISNWANNELIKQEVIIDDDGDKYTVNIKKISDDLLEITDKDKKIVTVSNKKIIPSDHWHPSEIKYNNMINTLDGEVLTTNVTKINSNTWFVDGKVKYFINYDEDGRWIGLKFNPDEDTTIEYICTSCN